MSLLVYGIIAAVIFASGFATGWKTDGWKHDSERLAQLEAAAQANDAAARRMDQSAELLESRIAALKASSRTFYNETRSEVVKPVYTSADCSLPPSGVVLRNRAAEAANNPSQPAPAVPADPKGGGKGNDARGVLPTRSGLDPDVRGMQTEAVAAN